MAHTPNQATNFNFLSTLLKYSSRLLVLYLLLNDKSVLINAEKAPYGHGRLFPLDKYMEAADGCHFVIKSVGGVIDPKNSLMATQVCGEENEQYKNELRNNLHGIPDGYTRQENRRYNPNTYDPNDPSTYESELIYRPNTKNQDEPVEETPRQYRHNTL